MALCKFIRSQCDKGRLIDTRLVGQFYKKNQNQTSDQQIYVFVPSSNNVVKVNYQSIASVCDCKTEVVQTFMARFKDLMLESIEKRQFGNCLCLNLKFGLLTIQKSGEIEFKNFSGQTYLDDMKSEVTFKSRATAFHSQARSQQNTIDSNLRQLQTNMQYGNMQTTGNGKIAMMTVASPQQQNNISLTTQTNFMNSRKLNSIVNRSFASPSGPSSMINSNKKLKRNDYNLNIQQSGRKLNQNQSVLIPQQSHGIDGQQQNDYLKEFLNTQQNYFKNDLQKVRGASSQNLKDERISQNSTAVSKNPASRQNNNQLIETIYNMKKQNVDQGHIREKALQFQQQQLNQIISNQKSYGKQRRNSQVNTLNKISEYNDDKLQLNLSSIVDAKNNKSAILQHDRSYDAYNQISGNTNNSGFWSQQNQQLASMNRTFLVNQREQSPSQIQHNSQYMPNKLLNPETQNNQLKTQSQFYSTANSNIKDPKTEFSQQLYSQNYPAFLRSNGPFQVYNHYKEKGRGSLYYESSKKAKEEAKKRLQDQLSDLKSVKEREKERFVSQIQNEEQNYRLQQSLKKLNNVENLMFIQMQIESSKLRKEYDHKEQKQTYSKPHFGPEETDELLRHQTLQKRLEQERVRQMLQDQIKSNQDQRKNQQNEEKSCDKRNIEVFNAVQEQEEKLKKLKEIENKKKLKKVWIEQMNVKKTKEDYNKIFQ
eukprot:403342962